MIATTCPYCGVGCGVSVMGGGTLPVSVQGDPRHPANAGKLCVKGSALAETLGLDGRLLQPQVAGQPVDWDTALGAAATGIQRIVAESGPDAVAFYASGQLLTEDYYVANKLMKGYLGTANIDTNSRLCMSSAVSGYKRAFGEDVVPASYADVEQANLVVLVGSNTAWCHPVLFQRIIRAKQSRPSMQLVVIDPRHTATCEQADLHLPLAPGTDVWLFNGLLHYLHEQGVMEQTFIQAHTQGLDAALATAGEADILEVAASCRLKPEDLLAFYQLFASCEQVVTLYSQGVNQSSSGTDKVNSIINCHLLTGRIGKPGAGPFSITGQPNAMGGREVGGMATMLAAHMELDNPLHRDRVQRFWRSPAMASKPGLKAVELFQAVAQGKVRAIWIMATNPVVSLPDADLVKRALQRCELVIVSDCQAETDTTAWADILFPAATWGEKNGTVTNSERVISRSRAFLPLPGAARPDWWIICALARRLGWGEAFAYTAPWQIFAEHAQLSAFENNGERCFNLEALSGLDAEGYEALMPTRWPARTQAAPPPFSDGRFYHADGRARFIATAAAAPMNAVDADYPLVLNTGRVRDHWHTMTRTGKAAKLADHRCEPFVNLHPHDVMRYGLREGELARLSSRHGEMVARAACNGGVREGQVFVPIHWNDATASDARVGALVNPVVDPVSGQPESKHTPVRIMPMVVNWHGFVLSREALDTRSLTYWVKVRGQNFWRYEIAGRHWPADASAWARQWFGATQTNADWLEYFDQGSGSYRAALLEAEQLQVGLYLSHRHEDLPERAWLSSLMGKQTLGDAERAGLLAGQSMNAEVDVGPVICSCYGIGRNQICAAIRTQGLQDTGQITACLKAGGNCGSCVPELKRLIIEVQAEGD